MMGRIQSVSFLQGGVQMFQDKDMEWLSIIECLKKTGMPIKDIKIFIDWCLEGDTTN